MAFSNIESSEALDIIDIAIVNNEDFENDEILKESFKELSDGQNDDRLFNTRYVSEDEAKKLLENDEIIGYLILEGNTPKIIVETSGIDETIFKYVTEEIVQTAEIVENFAETEISKEMQSGNYNSDYEKIYENALEVAQNGKVKIKNISNSNLSYTMIEFYTLIAMACLYGAIFGITSINQTLANMSSQGKRIGVAPISKLKIIFSSVLASYIVALIGLSLLFVYTIFVLKVDYGNNLPAIILLGSVGSLAGLSMGIAIGSLLKANENTKTGVAIAFTMFCCFLSGMMGITMKYIIDCKLPILNKINPASMITDGFYSLYYYDTLDRYYFNLISLLIFSVVMILISCLSLRRQRYDSI